MATHAPCTPSPELAANTESVARHPSHPERGASPLAARARRAGDVLGRGVRGRATHRTDPPRHDCWPLYLSGRPAVDTLDGLLHSRAARTLLDIGCGLGSVVAPLAQRHPQVRVTGIEAAPLPWLVSWLRTRTSTNASVLRGDFFAACWRDYDLVYAFLSPHPMATVWDKARREMHPGSLLVSKDFAVPEATPEEIVSLADGSKLYLYAPAGPAPARND